MSEVSVLLMQILERLERIERMQRLIENTLERLERQPTINNYNSQLGPEAQGVAVGDKFTQENKE